LRQRIWIAISSWNYDAAKTHCATGYDPAYGARLSKERSSVKSKRRWAAHSASEVKDNSLVRVDYDGKKKRLRLTTEEN